MRNIALLIVLALFATGCPAPEEQGSQAGSDDAPQLADGVNPDLDQVALVMSGTQGDDWSREIVQTVAGDLGFQAWSEGEDFEGIDVFGPYVVVIDGNKCQLHIAFSQLMSVGTLDEQQELAKRCKRWIDGFNPDVVWLDGDIAQMQVGNEIELDIPIVFSGVTLDADIYYSEFRPYTGVYKRHGLSAVIGRVWAEAPEAKRFSLIADDSPMTAVQVRRFVNIQALLGEGSFFTVMPTVHDWDELTEVLANLGDAEAVIICGMGNEGCSRALLDTPPPDGLLSGIDIPVVTLGPSSMDLAGAMTVSLKPAAHARIALGQVGKLLAGVDVSQLPVETPDDMSLFQAEASDG